MLAGSHATEFESEHYTLNLMVPLFDPGPIDHPDIPIHVAVIGPNMTAMAEECADGIRLHPVVTTKYIDEEVLPNLARVRLAGSRCRRGRGLSQAAHRHRPRRARLEQVIRTVRARCAFYLSTPSYRRAFAIHGWEDRAREASEYSRAGRWEEMPDLVDDDMLHTIATIGTYDQIADKLNERFASRLDRVEFSVPVNSPRMLRRSGRSWADSNEAERSSSARPPAANDETTVSVFLDEAASLGPLPSDRRAVDRRDRRLDLRLGHSDDRVVVGNADWSDVSAGQGSLVGDTADEIAGADVAPPTDTDVDQPGAGADVAALWPFGPPLRSLPPSRRPRSRPRLAF